VLGVDSTLNVWEGQMRARTLVGGIATGGVRSRPGQRKSSESSPHRGTAPRRAKIEDVNHRYPDGSTPLQWAVYEGDVAEVRRLLAAGADVIPRQRLRRNADGAGR
jgi:hypothetical protein